MIEQTTQIQHHHTFLQWVHFHWAEISLIWFPAGMGYLNAFVASCKVMGWSKLADFCGKLEDALTVFVATVKNQNKVSSTPEVPNVPKAS